MMDSAPRYWNSYAAGLLLGVLLFLAFALTSNGLGASGGLQRLTTFATDLVAPAHVDETPYLAKMAGSGRNALDNYLVIELAGVLLGGFLSGLYHRRLGAETYRGPGVRPRQRWFWAFLGGALMGFGARLARGCTSGQALSGGAVLSAGSWAFMLSVFAGGYGVAWFARRLWTGGPHVSA
jgi:uncharacterized membrane protein YedE/YeeE